MSRKSTVLKFRFWIVNHRFRVNTWSSRQELFEAIILDLESTGLAASTGLLELASLASDERLDTVVGVGVVDRRPLAEVGKGGTALRSSEKDGVRSSRGTKGELVESDALPACGENSLTGVGGEAEGADTQLGALHHADVVGDLANDDGDLAVLVRHVLRKTVKANGRGVDLGHVQALRDGGAKLGVGTASEELVQLDEETRVGVLRLDDLHRRLVARAAPSCFQIDTHGD